MRVAGHVTSVTSPRDPRRPGLATGTIVIGYAIFIGAIRAGFIPITGSDAGDIGPSTADLGALWLTVALALPGVIAGIAAVRRSGSLLITAGILCLGQAFIAFSGVTLPFIVPAIYLVVLGARTAPIPDAGRAMLAGFGVFVLVVAAWVTSLGLTETRCWTATQGPGGELVYATVSAAVADAIVLDETQVAAGCDGGSPADLGLTLGLLFAGTAVALAVWGTRPDGAGGLPAPA